MKNIGRRGMVGGGVAGVGAATFATAPPPPSAVNYAGESLGTTDKCAKLVQDSMYPKIEAARKYMRAQKNAPSPIYNGVDLNIDALKSVTPQHKQRMHWEAQARSMREYESWQTSILRMFDLDNEARHRLF